ncbi:MAG: DUF1552 domain-containing protein [Planctomycetia bacterium]|nr:DUF1552 domain-containing protein [Planctomycetia bacterium]
MFRRPQVSRPATARQGVLARRTVLRAAGAGVCLPLLNAMIPAFRPTARAAAVSADMAPRRIVAIHASLGMMPQFFFPEKPAGDAPADRPAPSSPYLDLLADHRGLFTVFSGMSHPDVDGNHHAGQCFLTGAPHPGQPTFRNSHSLDQVAAEHVGLETRFPFLALAVHKGENYSNTLAVSRSGVPIPSESSARRLYRSMFVAGTPEEKAAALRRIEAGGSVLDLVLDKATRLERSVGPEDRGRLDQYFSSVRELERRLSSSIEWERRPKPVVAYPEPDDIADANRVIEKSQLMFDMTRLALETDSTRVITLSLSTFSVVPHVPGVQNETHGLTHHGNEPAKIAELKRIEEAQMRAFGDLLQSLRDVHEANGNLLDHTQVLYGSCLGNANSHSNQNLPLVLAGGGYRHPGHLAFDEKRNEPFANLFVTMLQRLGIETDRFASSTGSLRGLES